MICYRTQHTAAVVLLALYKMISGATESSFKFLHQYLTYNTKYVAIDYNPHRLIKSQAPILILWAHYSYDQPIFLNVNWKMISHVVCVSEWQKQKFLKYFPLESSKVSVIRNGGADYFTYKSKSKNKTLIYTSTPFRGLQFMPEILQKIHDKHPDIQVKVFSGMSLYGPDIPDPYQDIYENLKKLSYVHYSPPIPHCELVKYLQDATIFCYPNTWEETSCVSLIEALRCGCYPVISDLGALPETSLDLGTIVPMTGTYTSEGAIPDQAFIDKFAAKTANILNNLDQIDGIRIAKKAEQYYDWSDIAKEWQKLINLLIGKHQMNLSVLRDISSKKIVEDQAILQQVFDEIFKWENYDKELAQGRTNFQIEKFIILDNHTIPSAFNVALKERRTMTEMLMYKIIEMTQRQRDFDYRWRDQKLDEPLKDQSAPGIPKLIWYDLDYLDLQNYLRSSELEIRDRVQQILFLDQLLEQLIKRNGGPITKQQYEDEDPIYWERRFANQAYDDILSKITGISVGNLFSMRRATAPTVLPDDKNRVKNSYPDLFSATEHGKPRLDFLAELQKKIIDGIETVTDSQIKLPSQESLKQIPTAKNCLNPADIFRNSAANK